MLLKLKRQISKKKKRRRYQRDEEDTLAPNWTCSQRCNQRTEGGVRSELFQQVVQSYLMPSSWSQLVPLPLVHSEPESHFPDLRETFSSHPNKGHPFFLYALKENAWFSAEENDPAERNILELKDLELSRTVLTEDTFFEPFWNALKPV